MKLWTRLALGAAFALMLASPISAADLGGNCCADLEERIAELEATTARKGNRKMTVTVYGEVHKGIMWHNGFEKSVKGVVDGGGVAPTRFGFMGEGKISPNWKAGFVIEIGVHDHPIVSATGPAAPLVKDLGIFNDLHTRHAFVYIEGVVGKATLGHTSMATDGVGQITLANIDLAAPMLSFGAVSNNVLLGIDLPYDGGRRDVVRYDSPVLSGFKISASWSSNAGVGLGAAVTPPGAPSDAWDVSLRYAGEFSGIRVAAGAGYRHEDHGVNSTGLGLLGHSSVMVGSASVMHLASGLFVNAAYGKGNDVGPFGFVPATESGVDHATWHAQGGIQKNAFGYGAMTFYGEYAQMDFSGVGAGAPQPTLYGLGVVQSIDAAATDLYLSYRHYDLDEATTLPNGKDNASVFMGGVRVRF